ncbi:MAG: tetratricopeptide repeat protein [Methylococcus sp.]
MRSPAKSKTPKSPEELEHEARRLLGQRQFKDAIPLLKDLLKRERRPEWKDQLAQAYLERARQLAGKGMFQDAAMLWENHAQVRKGPEPSLEYLDWLLQAGQVARLGQALAAATPELLATPAAARFLESLAILILENDKWLKSLPVDHPVTRQYPRIREAIAAYADGRDADLKECLQAIPSRSPYRNLSLLLRGLALLADDPQAGRAALGRVESASPCGMLAALLAEPASGRDVSAISLDDLPKHRAVLDRLRGYDKTQQALQRDLLKAAKARGVRALVETVLRNRNLLGDAISRRFCFHSLIGDPGAAPLYERAFGKLTPFELHRIRALHHEQERNYPEACDHWYACIDLLKRAPAEAREPFTQALIHRHVAGLARHGATKLAIDSLEKSLELDPDDRESYLRLIELLDEADDPKAAQTWLDRALRQYAADPEFLGLGIRSALRRKSFKKAAGYAKSLLKIDPINSQARQCLIEAHLGHARKQFKAQRWDLAEAELSAAREFDPHERNPARLYLDGLLSFFRADNEGCRDRWKRAHALVGNGAVAWFQWAMAVQSVGLAPSAVSRLVQPPDTKGSLDRAALLALVDELGRYAAEPRQQVALALAKLAPLLKRSFKQSALGEDDLLVLCQGLAAAGQYELLGECADKSWRRHFSPIFGYYQVLAECKGNPARLDFHGENRLRFLLNQAHHAKDHRALALIDQFLHRHEESLAPDLDFLPDLDFPFSRPEEALERLEGLENLDPVELLNQILGGRGEIEKLGQLPEKEAMDIIMRKLYDIAEQEDLPALPSPRGKPRKRR